MNKKLRAVRQTFSHSGPAPRTSRSSSLRVKTRARKKRPENPKVYSPPRRRRPVDGLPQETQQEKYHAYWPPPLHLAHHPFTHLETHAPPDLIPRALELSADTPIARQFRVGATGMHPEHSWDCQFKAGLSTNRSVPTRAAARVAIIDHPFGLPAAALILHSLAPTPAGQRPMPCAPHAQSAQPAQAGGTSDARR